MPKDGLDEAVKQWSKIKHHCKFLGLAAKGRADGLTACKGCPSEDPECNISAYLRDTCTLDERR